jgi:hypothetical protein
LGWGLRGSSSWVGVKGPRCGVRGAWLKCRARCLRSRALVLLMQMCRLRCISTPRSTAGGRCMCLLTPCLRAMNGPIGASSSSTNAPALRPILVPSIPEPRTPNPEPRTPNPEPRTPNPGKRAVTLCPRPGDPVPETLRHGTWDLDPSPGTLTPHGTWDLNPSPGTLISQRWLGRWGGGTARGTTRGR